VAETNDRPEAEELKALRREVDRLRSQLAELLARENTRLRKEEEDKGPRREFLEADRAYRQAKIDHGLDAPETIEAQRRLLEFTIDMLWAAQNLVRGPHMLAIAHAARALTDAVRNGTPWASMRPGRRGRGNPSTFARDRAIDYGLIFIATARAGHIDVGCGTDEAIFNAAKQIVADKYHVVTKTVKRWWDEAENAGRINDLTCSPESFLGLSAFTPEEDLAQAKDHLKEHILAMIDQSSSDMRRGSGH
jgi:hypothetical protein